MTIVRCPRCRDEVTVPPTATGGALVRCPLCLEEYLLAEALANAPPPLVIIGGEVEQAATASSPAGDDDYRLAGGGFVGALDASGPAVATAVSQRPAMRAQARPRRAEKSGLVLLVNYVVGGVLGLSLGLLVLWWGFRKDPLELGPPIARYTPWIVPTEFRGRPITNARPAASGGGAALASDGEATANGSPREATKKRGPKSVAAAAQPAEPVAELQTLPGLDEPGRLPTAAPAPLIDAPDLNGRGASRQPASEEPRPPMPDLTDLLPDGLPVAAAARPGETAPVTVAQFTESVDAAVAALENYKKVPRENNDEQRQAFSELHAAVGKVGRALAYLNAADPQVSEPVKKLGAILEDLAGATGTSRVRAIKFVALQKWATVGGDEGLLAAGTVADFQSAGSLFELKLDATNRDMPLVIPVTTTSDPRDLCKIGDELLIVGRVIDQPRENLAGYEGQQPRVLFSAFAVRVPKPE
jgi:hypothetical protein